MNRSPWHHRIPRTRLYLKNRELIRALVNLALFGPNKGYPVDRFERTFARRWGTAGAVAGSYARVCLYRVLLFLNLPSGSEIITTPITIHDMINVIRMAGLRPVFVDIDPRTFQMDPDRLEAAVTGNTRAVLVTHLFGMPADMDRIVPICRKHDLILLEDASHAFNAALHGRPLGTFGTAGIFSLSSLKTVSSGYGGMIVSDDGALLQHVSEALNRQRPCMRRDLTDILLKSLLIGLVTQRMVFSLMAFPGIRFLNRWGSKLVTRLQTDNPDRTLLHSMPRDWLWGFSPIQAELAMACLQRLNRWDERRRMNAQVLMDVLTPVAPDRIPRLLPDATNVFWHFPFRAPEKRAFQRFMNRRGIDVSGTLLPCCSREPVFKDFRRPTPHAQQAVEEIYFLPVEPSLCLKQAEMVAQAASDFVTAGG